MDEVAQWRDAVKFAAQVRAGRVILPVAATESRLGKLATGAATVLALQSDSDSMILSGRHMRGALG